MSKQLLALVMSVLLLTLTACSGVSSPLAAPESNSPAENPAAAPVSDKDLYEIKWYVNGPGPQPDLEMVLNAFNEKVKEKLPVKLNLVMLDWGNFDQQMQMIIAAQEKFDLCFTANWANNYYVNVNKGAFLELTDLLNEHGPNIMNTVPKVGWEAAKVNGGIYAILNYQVWPLTNGFTITNEILDKYNIDIHSIKKLEDLDAYASAVTQGEPDMYAIDSSKGLLVTDVLTVYNGYDELAGRNIPGAILLDSSELTVVNQFELPDFRNTLYILRDWYQKGYVRQDAATLGDCRADQKAGTLPFTWEGNIKPGGDVESAMSFFDGRAATSNALSSSWLMTSSIISTMTAISVTSENPELVMQFYDLIYSDKELYNLLCYGVEGTHYTRADGDFIALTGSAGYLPNTDWLFGNQFNAYILEGKSDSIWADTIALNESARPSPALGFSFDPTSIQTEIANVSAVKDEYIPMLSTGSVDVDTVLPEFLEKLKAAGADRIVAEVQSQLDAWKSDF